MKNNLITFNIPRVIILTLSLIVPLCQNSWASNDVDSALELRKQGNFNQSIKQLKIHHQNNPQDIRAMIELAASYYMAHHFSAGSDIFKQVLQSKKTPENIKANVTEFINRYREAIKTQQGLNERLLAIRNSKESVTSKLLQVNELLYSEPEYTPAQTYQIHLYLLDNQLTKAKQLLTEIKMHQVTPEDETRFLQLDKRYRHQSEPRSLVSASGSLFLGYDSNITGDSDSDIIDELFKEGLDEEFADEFDEDAFYDEEFDEEFDINEDEEQESATEPQGGLFSLLSGRLDYSLSIPQIENGALKNTREYGLHASYSERHFADDIADNRNYQVLGVGGLVGIKYANGSRLLFPVNLKMIRLNNRNYSLLYEGKVAYSFRHKQTAFSLIEKLSYRNYSEFNEERENGLLLETRARLYHPLSSDLTFHFGISIGQLNTLNEDYRSYIRYTLSGSLSYQLTPSMSLTTGGKYLLSEYKGENELFVDEVGDPIYDFSREDNQMNLYAEGHLTLNPTWGMKVKASHTDRQSNQQRYEYDRSTISVGLTAKY
ncbi:MAG: hypothetical protein COA42_18710 [Alteromonadaceae bacterium]|nr:MAG: hypothetical protein COA42_18710 [Alteromonadaceae bacterium]